MHLFSRRFVCLSDLQAKQLETNIEHCTVFILLSTASNDSRKKIKRVNESRRTNKQTEIISKSLSVILHFAVYGSWHYCYMISNSFLNSYLVWFSLRLFICCVEKCAFTIFANIYIYILSIVVMLDHIKKKKTRQFNQCVCMCFSFVSMIILWGCIECKIFITRIFRETRGILEWLQSFIRPWLIDYEESDTNVGNLLAFNKWVFHTAIIWKRKKMDFFRKWERETKRTNNDLMMSHNKCVFLLGEL